jgi:hypothetical protein
MNNENAVKREEVRFLLLGVITAMIIIFVLGFVGGGEKAPSYIT